MEKIVAFHELNYKEKVTVMAEVPGVVTVMGAFSDFCDGYCLAGTGALGLRVALSPRDDMVVRVYDATRGDKKRFNLTVLKHRKEDRWANCVKGVFHAIATRGVKFPHGFDMTFKGALLYCDDLTVTASVVMGTILALDKALGLGLGRDERIHMAYNVATSFCKVPVRFRDLVTVSYAEKGRLLYFDLQNGTFELVDYPFQYEEGGDGPYSLIVDPSLPPQILREELEEKRIDARACCRVLKSRLPQESSLRSYPVKDLRNHTIVELDEHVRHTCQFVLSETQLVVRGRKAIQEADASLFGKCLSDVYLGMRDVFDVMCPEVDWLIRRAGELDHIYGASYVSNGASGSILMILDRKGEEALSALADDYKHFFDFQMKTRFFRPGGVAHVVDEIG